VPVLDPVAQPEPLPVASVAPRVEAYRILVTPGLAQRNAAMVMAVGSAVALGTAVGFSISARSAYESASANCTGRICNSTGEDAQSRAYGQAAVATVATVAGGAALVGAAILWFTAPSSPSAVRLQPVVGRAAWSLSLQGGW
jgi:hypothetical protein